MNGDRSWDAIERDAQRELAASLDGKGLRLEVNVERVASIGPRHDRSVVRRWILDSRRAA